MRLDISQATDLGLRRTQNEDCLGTWIPDDPDERDRHGALLVVADGMGGARAGEVASRMTVDTVLSVLRASPGVDPLAELHDSIEAANRRVHEESVTHPGYGGMGTTCTAVMIRDRELLWAHVGDSRLYRVHGRRIEQLTHDHSLVAQLVRDGHLTAEQARTDPRRNVVTRSVGIGDVIDVDSGRLAEPLAEGDSLLLCTDGLHGLVEDDELLDAASGAELDQACRTLVALARERGGHDNITLILARLRAA